MIALRSRAGLLVLCLAWIPAAAPAAGDPAALLQRAVEAACDEPSPSAGRLAARIPGSTVIADDPLEARDGVVGWKRRFELPSGAEIRIERIAPGDRLRRLSAEYWTPAPDGGVRPRLALIADGTCTVRTGRRLLYEPASPNPVAVEILDRALAATGTREPLDPPVPAGDDPGGVAVALVDAGVNYLLPEIGRRLARDRDGGILGFDYWDNDERPFDANPAYSPFFPQRHGTRTASLLLREAPMARLVPYRYPRPDMSRMTELIEDAAALGVSIMNISMGSDDGEEWKAFAAAARSHPQMLFILSAGNNGRDIDARPVYPAALRLENTITVTSSENDGELAPGSNWGRESVDLMVPAERMPVMNFDGDRIPASGSSYAAVRVSALAARLLAAHPGWHAPELKAAVFERVLPPFGGHGDRVARGFLPRPDRADRLPPMSGAGEPVTTGSHAFETGDLYPDPDHGTARGHVLRPAFAYFENTQWSTGALKRHARDAAAILARCDIFITSINVHVLDGPVAYRYFHDVTGRELVARTGLPKPTVYFVRDTLQTEAYDAEAIGRSNSTTRPMLRDTIWVTEDTREPGLALAHELAHLLMDSGRHVETPGNLMSGETAPGNTGLTQEQCDAMVETGTANGLLTARDRQ